MGIHVNIGEAKTRLQQLVAASLRGEEVTLARAGKAVVQIVPLKDAADAEKEARARAVKAWIGSMAGQFPDTAGDYLLEPAFTDAELDEFERKIGFQRLRLLVDTNVLTWAVTENKLMSGRAARTLADANASLFVSVVSAWEYQQKRLLRPDQLPMPFDTLTANLPHERLDLEFDVFRHAATLPLIHRDPFDRMLIAQALHHGLTLVASDADIRRYDVPTIW